MRRFLPLLALLLPSSTPADAPSELDAILATYSKYAHFPLPDIAGRELSRLEDGRILKVRDVPDDPDLPIRVVGLLITDRPRDELWLANRDTHYSITSGATEALLSPRGEWPQVWYQHIDAPRPFADRHWTIDVSDTWQLAQETKGQCWEHWWQLNPEGLAVGRRAVADGRVPRLSTERIDDAIYTPVSHGAWLMCTLGDHRTLLGYHTTAKLGGRIPDKMIATWGMATLGRMFRIVEEQSLGVREHYTGEHYLIHGGDGQEMPLF